MGAAAVWIMRVSAVAALAIGLCSCASLCGHGYAVVFCSEPTWTCGASGERIGVTCQRGGR